MTSVEQLIQLFSAYRSRTELDLCVSNAQHSGNFNAEVWVDGYRTLFGARSTDEMMDEAGDSLGDHHDWVSMHRKEVNLIHAWARTQFDADALPYIAAVLGSEFDWNSTLLGEGIRDLLWAGVPVPYFASAAEETSFLNYPKLVRGYSEGIPLEYLAHV